MLGRGIAEIWPGFTIECVPISYLHGPGALDKSNSALILSTESRSEVTGVNDLRSHIGWADSDVFNVGMARSDAFEIIGGSVQGTTWRTKANWKVAVPGLARHNNVLMRNE